MKKLIHNPNGSSTYTNDEGQPDFNGHYCPYGDEIKLLKTRMNGDEDAQGTFADVKQILKNQESNRSWIKGSVFTFTGFIIMLFYFGITDHNKIMEFPDTYISKSALNQVVMELKQQTAVMTRIVNSPNIDSLLVYRYELSELQQHSSFDQMMKAVRGGTSLPKTKRDSIYREIMTEKAKEYLKNKDKQ